ncbi:hypothetical protein [Prauserella flavalba]|uniref:Uncharacterized protein n=1 Tax=Prauserella flavalba TaxID=1477506 RepID=A0A318M197_9PSEU|nr:hypothetical protein [Prauserella flavalba]PXY36315.1 hypothetical protein BA062_12940 [Prauserella flavalba]
MNSVEKAADAAMSREDWLQPLERADKVAPVLGTPGIAAVVACGTALFAAGNMVTDLVGHESRLDLPGEGVSGKSGTELLALRREGLRG